VVQVDVEPQYVVSEAARRRHDAFHLARRTGARIGRVHEARYFGHHIGGGRTLAHQELARALEVLLAARLRPGIVDRAGDQARLARAAGAGRAFVGQVDARAQAREEDLLPGLRLELVGPVPRVDLDPHRV
jgi:hypothetical protein